MSVRERMFGKRHAASYYWDGWTVECECGWSYTAKTKKECTEAYREHRSESREKK